MRPKKLENIVGQEKAKEVISTLINLSKKTEEPVPHILLSAAAGCGKTSFAQAIANDIDTNFYSINCATVNKPNKIFNIIEEMSDKDVLFLDEIHGLSKKTCETLYTILEDFCYYDEGYKVEIPKITIIGASTEIGKLPLPLKSRFKYTATLEPYTEEQLADVCKMVCEEKGFKLSRNLAKIIAKTCRGVPRNMVSRAEWLYAYMTGNSIKTIDKNKMLDIIALQGVNADGLEEHDLKYLKTLYDSRGGLSLDALASKMSMDRENIKTLIEPYLNKLNFIEISAGKGRGLTREGKKYIEKVNK